MDGSSSNQLSELGVPQLLNLADFLIEGDKFVGLLLSLVGLISLHKFGGLLLKLSSEDPTHLLREDSAHDTFWKILQQEGASCQSGMEALPKLQPFFIDRMQKLSPCRQAGSFSLLSQEQWLGVLKWPSQHLPMLFCQSKRITAMIALEASAGELMFKLSFFVSPEDVANGWGVFLCRFKAWSWTLWLRTSLGRT